MKLLPYPRVLKRTAGFCCLPAHTDCHFDADLPPELRHALFERLASAAAAFGVQFQIVSNSRNRLEKPQVNVARSLSAPAQAEGYTLSIRRGGLQIGYREIGGLRAAIATVRQLFREYGARLPCVEIRDWPEFARRGVMLDISRGRVPKLDTLLALADHLADFKINEFQLYVEHTFAYRNYRRVWESWGAVTGTEIVALDSRCRELGVDLVPNQNSFGHLRHFLEHPRLKGLAEVAEPYESEAGDFLRRPSTLAPKNRGTLPFLRELYDELLPNFSSRNFNVGCDETWDLSRGQSRRICARLGTGRVYLDFLKKIHREVSRRGRRMMFWGDIILKHPELIGQLPKDALALNWGYEANHPFHSETAAFAQSGNPFYVCPGTSTWMSLIGRHDVMLANVRRAAIAGTRHGAEGLLVTDWGDGGHPQPLAVSYLPYLTAAAGSWCRQTFDEQLLVPVLSRDVFADPTQNVASAAWHLGFAHRSFGYTEPNATPFGTVIAAPPPEQRELFCRNGLKCYAAIPRHALDAAIHAVDRECQRMLHGCPVNSQGGILALELKLAAEMAKESCQFMRWQQTVAAGRMAAARRVAEESIKRLRELQAEFAAYWPLRNKATPAKCFPFLDWRIADYRCGRAHVDGANS